MLVEDLTFLRLPVLSLSRLARNIQLIRANLCVPPCCSHVGAAESTHQGDAGGPVRVPSARGGEGKRRRHVQAMRRAMRPFSSLREKRRVAALLRRCAGHGDV